MMRSLYAGVSGLNNHQTRMDVIGNNVSNVNTTGFKRGRVVFHDLLSQTLDGASRPSDTRGGTNPKQVGLGVSLATIDTIHTQGSLQTTGVNTDLAVLGNGFFIQKNGEQISYTRNGAFGIDATNHLVNPSNGLKIQGYRLITNPDGSKQIDTQGPLTDVVIPLGEKAEAEPTKVIRYKSNLSTTTPLIPQNNPTAEQTRNGTWRTSIFAIDSEGYKQEVNLSFTKAIDDQGVAIPNVWNVQADVVDQQGRAVNNLSTNAQQGGGNANSQFTVTFNTAGAIVGVQDGLNNPTANPVANGQNINVFLSYAVDGVNPQNISLDLGQSGMYTGITQFSSPSSTSAYYQDGLEMGYLESFNIDNRGIITGSYTNSAKKEIGQIALGTFSNPQGLTKIGETAFMETPNSGQVQIIPPGEKFAGELKAGTLEMSNVDLATEFTDMIVTERGFQANSRVITTSDTMLQELLRLKQ